MSTPPPVPLGGLLLNLSCLGAGLRDLLRGVYKGTGARLQFPASSLKTATARLLGSRRWRLELLGSLWGQGLASWTRGQARLLGSGRGSSSWQLARLSPKKREASQL